MPPKTLLILSWILQVTAALVMLQTLFFKFTGAAESKYIFTTLGVEPWGRFASGAFELVAALLLLWPTTAACGAVLGIRLMTGALASHATKLGVVVQDDGGLLFGLALVVLASCAAVATIRRAQLLHLVHQFV